VRAIDLRQRDEPGQEARTPSAGTLEEDGRAEKVLYDEKQRALEALYERAAQTT